MLRSENLYLNKSLRNINKVVHFVKLNIYTSTVDTTYLKKRSHRSVSTEAAGRHQIHFFDLLSVLGLNAQFTLLFHHVTMDSVVYMEYRDRTPQ